MRRIFPTSSIAVRWLAGVQQRFVRARSGSVLILVVALLVILALIGTAWMVTTRNDRYTTVQNTANTQIDLLVEGVVALVEAEILSDLFAVEPVSGNQAYR